MKEQYFDDLVESRCRKIAHTLSVKGKEYRRNGNVFHNFEVGARITGESREKVLVGFLLKHLVSVLDMVNDLEVDIEPSDTVVDEKIGDMINYLVILEASLKDRNS